VEIVRAGAERIPDLQPLWESLSRHHAEVAPELAEVRVGRAAAWLRPEHVGALESPPAARGVRLLPPGDPYLQKPNRALLAPDPVLRKRLFRPVASPGAVLRDGRLSGLWRARAKGAKLEVTVEPLRGISREDLGEEVRRIAELRGARDAVLVVE
jgi:hypothetical protein